MLFKMQQKILVSVCMITYNHEKFIEQAIDGVLMQLGNFELELIISNDCSTDKTGELIEKTIRNNPNNHIIKHTKHSKNLGMMPNFIWALNKCSGKYIALCEGDDYWTDPYKLQKQVDYLEANLDYSFCGHKSTRLSNQVFSKIELGISELTFERLILKNSLNTATLVFRNQSISNLPNFFNKSPAADWLLQLLALKNGKGYVLDDYMSVYREHENGIWSSLSNKKKCESGVKVLKIAKNFYNDPKSKVLINEAISRRRQNFNAKEDFIGKILKIIKKIRNLIKK